jgi:hypothetical protein
MRSEPAWILTRWGPGATWQQVRILWFSFLTGAKVFIFFGGILPGLANIMGQAIAKIDKEIDDSIMRPTLRVK